MDEKQVQQTLIEILYSIVNTVKNNESINENITPELLSAVYRLAKQHDLGYAVSHYVYQNQTAIDHELQAQLQQEEMLSVYRCEQMKYTLDEICGIFDEVKVAYIPLKGSVIRPYYPYENMRTSCDIDILIHEDDLQKAIDALQRHDYRCGMRNYHDVSLHSPNDIHLELHFNIQENKDNLDAILKDAWKYAAPTNGTRYVFTDEFFSFYLFAHMAYHFLSGGCGIRALLDIWVMEHKMGISYSCAEELLKKASIYQFATEMRKLAERCFTYNDRDAFSDMVLKYIFCGGVYGSAENHIAVDKFRHQNCVAYALKRFFLPYKSMVTAYPILVKFPFLLPLCWLARLKRAIFGGKTKRIAYEMSCFHHTPDTRIEEVEYICSKLGL